MTAFEHNFRHVLLCPILTEGLRHGNNSMFLFNFISIHYVDAYSVHIYVFMWNMALKQALR